jgi:hypothetical protein
MKLHSRILSVAFLATLVLTPSVSAIGVALEPALGGLLVAPRPTLRVIESPMGYHLEFNDMGPGDLTGLVFGRMPGFTLLDLGSYGVVQLAVHDVAFAMFVGVTDSVGAVSLYLPRPTTLPPELEGFTFTLQGVSVPRTQKSKRGPSLTNTEAMTLSTVMGS